MMKRTTTFALLASLLGGWTAAAAEMATGSFTERCLKTLDGKLKTATSERKKDGLRKRIANTRRIESAIAAANRWTNSPVACYSVPAMSPIKRLPDVLPADGRLVERLRAIGAKGEFVPASFVVFPFEDMTDVRLICSDLKGEGGVIAAGDVDLKVVKCWYQSGTAWHSYFKDPTRRVLVPELLLNDENLVKVDHEKKDNYLRADYPEGSEYLWMSFPGGIAPRPPLNILTEPIADSPTLLPVTLIAGECKQFWLTIKIPEKAKAGFYDGVITMKSKGKTIGALKLTLRVLPFALPEPKTYYDLDREFIVSIYDYMEGQADLRLAGGDKALLKRQVVSMYKDMLNHNIRQFHLAQTDPDMLSFYFEAQKEAGVKFDQAFGPYRGFTRALIQPVRAGKDIPAEVWDPFVKRHNMIDEFRGKNLPNTQFYSFGGSEIGWKTLDGTAKPAKNIADRGVSNYVDMHLKNLIKAGAYNVDLFNTPYDRNARFEGEEARIAHALGLRLMSYASPHSGPENPDLIRRTHGLMLYKSDYDGVKQCGYKPKLWYSNCWNEFGKPGQGYRINFIYPTREGVVDTLHWEGFREGIDDIRYATKLLQLARAAIATGDVDKRYAAKKAMQYLGTLDWRAADLNAARLEMINFILELQEMLKKGAA